MSTYVYGIIRAAHSPPRQDIQGIGDPPRPVRVLREGELAAIVSDAPEELRPKRRDLLAHQRVLDEAGAGGVVLPMRFGSASPDADTVTTVLAFVAIAFVHDVVFVGPVLAVEGFMPLAGLPVALDWSELQSGPGRAGTSTGFLLLAGNLGGVVFVLAVQVLIGDPYVALAAISALALPGVLLAARLPPRAPSDHV